LFGLVIYTNKNTPLKRSCGAKCENLVHMIEDFEYLNLDLIQSKIFKLIIRFLEWSHGLMAMTEDFESSNLGSKRPFNDLIWV